MAGKRSNGEGTLRKRPNGLWDCTMMVGYKDDGTRRYKSFYGKSQIFDLNIADGGGAATVIE